MKEKSDNEQKEWEKEFHIWVGKCVNLWNKRNRKGNKYNKLGVECSAANKFELAIEYFKKALKMLPKDGLILYNIAWTHFSLRNFTKAINYAESALKLELPNTLSLVDFYDLISDCYYNLDEYDKSLEYINKAVVIDSTIPDFHNTLGNIHDSLKDYDKAIEEYQTAIRLGDTNSVFYCNLANTYYNLGRFDEAIEKFKEAIERNDKCEEAFSGHSLSLIRLKKYKEAEEVITKAMLIFDKSEEIYYARGVVALKLANYSLAYEYISTSISIDLVEYAKLYNTRRYYYLARSLLKRGVQNKEQKMEILINLNKSIEFDKEWSKSYYRRAEYYLSLAPPSYNLALTDLQTALKNNPSYFPVHQLSSTKLTFISSVIHSISSNLL